MRAITKICLLPCIAASITACDRGAQSETPERLGAEERAVVEVANALFDAMQKGDTAALRAVLLPNARFIAASGNRLEESEADYFIGFLGHAEEVFLERLWDPEVRVEGPIATVWAPYDFHRDGAFSHCGIDAFQLVRSENSWRIASIIYTVQREQCSDSPLGAPS